ncbi:MAG: DUF5723 family protein [Bacteroidales bacterium]|nr:DUF5723 family protein [Bacteroidales bacterium]
MRKSVCAVAALLIFCVCAGAQNPPTSFMLDNHVYGYRFNPAFIPEKSFFSIAIGNVNPNFSSGIGLSTLIHPTDDGLVTGLNSAIPAETFLSGISKMNPIDLGFDENVLAVGFRGKKGGYSTFEVNAHIDAAINIPYSLFAFLKSNGQPTYDLSGFDVGANACAELTYGFAKSFRDKFAFGFRVHGIVGLASLAFDLRKAQITMDSENIAVSTDAGMLAACTFMETATTESQYDPACSDVYEFKSFKYDFKKLRPSGYGATLDFGAMYEPVRGLEIHLAVTNLGVMAWNYNIAGNTDAEAVYQGEEFSPETEEGDSEFGEEINAMMKSVNSLAEFHEAEAPGYTCTLSPFRVNAAVKYRMPFWRRLMVGAMGTYRYSNVVKSYDARGALTVTPLDWISLTANAGYSTYGFIYGGALSLNAGPVALYASMDGYAGKMAKWIPDPEQPKAVIKYPVDKFSMNFSFGLLFQFGKRVASKYNRHTEIEAE